MRITTADEVLASSRKRHLYTSLLMADLLFLATEPLPRILSRQPLALGFFKGSPTSILYSGLGDPSLSELA